MIGDLVLIAKFSGARWWPDPINEPELEYHLLRLEDLLAVITEG